MADDDTAPVETFNTDTAEGLKAAVDDIRKQRTAGAEAGQSER